MTPDDSDRRDLLDPHQEPADMVELDEAADWSELDDDPTDLGGRLRSLLDPDEHLQDRTRQDVDRTLRGRSVLATGLDLLSLGVRTVSTLLSDPPGDADEYTEGDPRWK